MLVSAIFGGLSLVDMRAAAAQPPRFHYQAILKETNGQPVTGLRTIIFWLYQGGSADVADSGTRVFQESVALNITDGVVNHSIGTGINFFGGPLHASMFRTNADVYIQ